MSLTKFLINQLDLNAIVVDYHSLWNTAFTEGQNSVDLEEVKREAYDEGYECGHSEGYDEGYNDADNEHGDSYDQGYEAAKQEFGDE